MDEAARYRFGAFQLDPSTFRLLRGEAIVPLEPKALDVLRVLVDRAPAVVEKSELFAAVWKDVAVTDNALTRVIAHIRRALDDDAKAPRYIETVSTRGYRFAAHVTTASADAPDDPVGRVPAAQRGARFRDATRWLVPASTLFVVLLAAGSWLGPRYIDPGRSAGATSRSARTPEVARLAALRPQQVTTGTGYDGFLAFAPDGSSMAFASDRSGALEIYVQGLAPGSTAMPLTTNGRQNVQPAWSPDGRFIAYHEMAGNGIWIVPSRGGAARRVADFGSHPAWSPDGRRLAFQSLPLNDVKPLRTPGALSTIWIVDVFGRGKPTPVTAAGEPAGPHVAPVWWRGSNRILFANPGALSVHSLTSLWSVDVDTRQMQAIGAHERLSPDFVLAPDGRSVYFISRGTNTIWWVSLDEHRESGLEPQPTGLAAVGSMTAGLSISPDGRRLAWTVLDSSSHIWATATQPNGQLSAVDSRPLTEGGGVHFGFPSVAADGRIAFVGMRHGAGSSLFLLLPNAAVRQLTMDPANHSGAQWMPGERELAFVADHGEGLAFWEIDTDSGRERQMFPLSALHPPGDTQPVTASPAANIAIAPDARRLAMAIVRNGAPNIWTAFLQKRAPGALNQRTFEREGGTYPAWSPDGRWIAYQCAEGTNTHVCVTDAGSGSRVQLTREPGQSWIGGWTPDSRTIIYAARRRGLWNVAAISRDSGAARTLTRFTQPRIYVRYPRWDPANHRVVFERSETTARLWSVDLE